MKTTDTSHSKDLATLAGGCFWCLESIFAKLNGVTKVTSGYAGGSTVNPTYEEVCAGNTGHAECIQISHNPLQITYGTLLEVFFAYHDPTTPNRQGNDIGTQYRSAIFAHDDTQTKTANKTIHQLTDAQAFDKPIITEIVKLDTFYIAEDYHQSYFINNPNNPYCNAVITPKLAKLRQKHLHLIS